VSVPTIEFGVVIMGAAAYVEHMYDLNPELVVGSVDVEQI
jgi:hypothetical protein